MGRFLRPAREAARVAEALGIEQLPDSLTEAEREDLFDMTDEQLAQLGDQLDGDSAEDLDAEQLTAEDLAEMEADTELAALFAGKPEPVPSKAATPVEATPVAPELAGPQPISDEQLRDPAFCFGHAVQIQAMAQRLASVPIARVGSKFTLPE